VPGTMTCYPTPSSRHARCDLPRDLPPPPFPHTQRTPSPVHMHMDSPLRMSALSSHRVHHAHVLTCPYRMLLPCPCVRADVSIPDAPWRIPCFSMLLQVRAGCAEGRAVGALSHLTAAGYGSVLIGPQCSEDVRDVSSVAARAASGHDLLVRLSRRSTHRPRPHHAIRARFSHTAHT
jgi:hypothetical protein